MPSLRAAFPARRRGRGERLGEKAAGVFFKLFTGVN